MATGKKFSATEVREMLLLDDFSDDESIHSEEEALPNDDEVNNITSSEDEIDDDGIEDMEMEMEGDLNVGIIAKDGTVWKTEPPAHNKYRLHNTVSISSGPTVNVVNRATPVDIFKYLIDDTDIDDIVQNTNKRIDFEHTEAHQFHENISHDITNTEMYAYIGILILQGVLKKEILKLQKFGKKAKGRFIGLITSVLQCHVKDSNFFQDT